MHRLWRLVSAVHIFSYISLNFFPQHSMIYFYHHIELPYVVRQIELQEMFSQRQLQYLRQQGRPPSRRGFRVAP